MKLNKSSWFLYNLSLYMLLGILSIFFDNLFFIWFNEFHAIMFCVFVLIQVGIIRYTKLGDYIDYEK